MKKEKSPRADAERIYALSMSSGSDPDIDALCEQYPRIEGELRAVHAGVQRALGVLPRPSSSRASIDRIRELYGAESNPNISLEGETEPSEDFTSEIVRGLGERGKSYGRYKLKGEVARGGQGAILRVWDEDLRRNLAMKVVLGQGDATTGDTPKVDSKTLGRFLEEAQVTGQLDHPGIVPERFNEVLGTMLESL